VFYFAFGRLAFSVAKLFCLLISRIIQYFPSDKQENFAFKGTLQSQARETYMPSHAVCRRLRIGALSLSKIASSLMVVVSGDSKLNLGLNLKFEAKSLKVLGYTRKGDGGWEYSETAVELISEYKARRQ